MAIEFVKTVNVEYTSVEVKYLEWVGKTIKEQQAQIADLVAALEIAPRPMTSLTAEELKANWKAVDHWFAVYDSWMEDIATKALLAKVKEE